MKSPMDPANSNLAPRTGVVPQTREAALRSQQRSFRELLRYVWRHSRFYRDYYSSHGIGENDLRDVAIRDLPVLSKRILMENFDATVTDSRLRKRDLEKWIQDVRDPRQLYRDNFIVLHTSGSSGEIGIFVYDLKAWRIMNATVARYLPPPENGLHGKTRVACYLASHGHFGGVTTAVQMTRSAYDVLVVSLLDATERVLEQLNDFQPHRLSGYSSSVALLAESAIRGELHIHPQTITVSGDPLTQSIKRMIQEAWQAPIYDIYAATESLYVAVKPWGREDMIAMDELNVLEILDRENRPVVAGELGRAVLTNLCNYALPVVRYELGDAVVAGTDQRDSPFMTIRRIDGRMNEALPVVLHDGKRDKISPIVLGEFFVPALERIQYVSRRPDHVQIRYVGTRNIDAAIRKEFQRILQLKGASKTTFEIRRVERLVNDPKTGKFSLVKLPMAPGPGSETVADGVRSEDASGRGPGTNGFSDSIGNSRLQAIAAKCSRPRGTFLEFTKEQVEQSVTDRFELQVAQYPERIAVKTKDHALTYAALDKAANRAARAIVARCGGGAQPAALLLERNSAATAAVLGVFKAGKIYVPLDPSYPRERLAAILEDSQASLILTDGRNRALALELASGRYPLLNVDELDPDLPAENLGLSISSDAVAAIFYTSGSTGQPKGVMQSHRTVLHRVMIDTNHFHICPEDRLSLLSSPSYSASLHHFFGALLNGAALCPFNIEEEGVGRLAPWLAQEKITIYFSVPTVFRHFATSLTGQENFPALRLICLGGESATRTDVELYRKYFSRDCIFVNSLASNETGDIRQYFVDKQTELEEAMVPAGYEVEDKEILLLGETGKPLGCNQVGEIAVRSRYLSPGYWRQPDVTAAAFLPDPERGDRRIYFTGDLGRILPDGRLIHLGRKDGRVKIRGQGVEVAEVETALLEHAAVKEGVIVAQDDSHGEKGLVAYVVPSQTPAPATKELRSFLEKKLPDFMIPSLFVFLESLPLTPNGKVDRGALPVPSQPGRSRRPDYAPPRGAVEQKLVEIWEEALGVRPIGIHDDFFDLGGHSILAMRIISGVAEALGVELSIRKLLDAPTVATLAGVIDSMRRGREKARPSDRARC